MFRSRRMDSDNDGLHLCTKFRIIFLPSGIPASTVKGEFGRLKLLIHSKGLSVYRPKYCLIFLSRF